MHYHSAKLGDVHTLHAARPTDLVLTKTFKAMKAFIFKVTLVTGMVIVCNGIGTNVDNAMMDACDYLASTDYPQDDIVDVELVNAEEEQA